MTVKKINPPIIITPRVVPKFDKIELEETELETAEDFRTLNFTLSELERACKIPDNLRANGIKLLENLQVIRTHIDKDITTYVIHNQTPSLLIFILLYNLM